MKYVILILLAFTGLVYGEDAKPKRIVNTGFEINIGENGRNEVAMIKQLETLNGTTIIDNKQFDNLLRKYSDLMITGRVLGHKTIDMEIGRQTDFFSCAYRIWYGHPELKNKDSTNYLKGLSDSIYYLIKDYQIPNYTHRPASMLSVAWGGEPPPAWKEYARINNENNHENMIQMSIQNSLSTLNFCTRAIDKFLEQNN